MGWNGDDFKCFKFLTRKIRSEFRPIKNFATPESTPKCISENFEPERKFQTREILTQIWVMANLLFRNRFRMFVFLNLLRLSKWYPFNGTRLRPRKIILLKVIQTKFFWPKKFLSSKLRKVSKTDHWPQIWVFIFVCKKSVAYSSTILA